MNSALDQIIKEDQEQTNAERIAILEEQLAAAHERLDIQNKEIKALARKILRLENNK